MAFDVKKSLPVVALVVVAIALFAFSGVNFGTGAVVSVSQVSLTNGGQNLAVNLVLQGIDNGKLVENIDPAQTINASNLQTSSGTVKAQSGLSLSFSKGQQFCTYNVQANTLNLGLLSSVLGIQGFTYYTINTPLQHYPYDLTVSKFGLQNYQVFPTGQQSGTIDVNKNSPTVQNIQDFQSGNTIQVNTLGLLGGGGQCPSGSATAFVPSGNTFIPVAYTNVQTFASVVQQCAFNLAQCPAAYSVYQQMLTTPTNEFLSCPQYTSCTNQLTFSSSQVKYTVNSNLGSPQVLITAPLSEFNAFYYTPPNGIPQVTMSTTSNQLVAQQYSTVTVSVTNAGTTGDGFQLLFSNRANDVSYPSPDSMSIPAGQTLTRTYQIQASTGNANDAVCVQVTAVGSGKQANQCVGITVVNPVQPSATPIPTTTVTPTSPIAPGQGNTVFCAGNPPTAAPNNDPTKCPQDYTALLLGLAAVIVAGAVVFSLLGKKGGKGGPGLGNLLNNPLVLAVIVGVVAYFVAANFLAGFTIPFFGNPVAGLAPVIGLVLGVVALFYFRGGTQINISGVRVR